MFLAGLHAAELNVAARLRALGPEASSWPVIDAERAIPSVEVKTGLVLAYASTIHKTRGSEHPAVVIPLNTQHYARLAGNLLNMAATRGRRPVVLVGQRRALAIAVRDGGARRR